MPCHCSESPGTASGSSNSEKESGTESAEPKVVVMDTGIRKQDRDERRRSKKRLTFGTEVEHIPYQSKSLISSRLTFRSIPRSFSSFGTQSRDPLLSFGIQWKLVIVNRNSD
jgi:hypothetical protein